MKQYIKSTKRGLFIFILGSLMTSCWSWEPKELALPPTATFTVTNDGCVLGCTITCTSNYPDAASYQWDISDGSTFRQSSFSKQFTSIGSYTVKLTVTNKAGARASSEQTVRVNAQVIAAPTADFSFTGGDCTAACEVAFTNKSSGNASSYLWSFGDNTANSTETNPKHTYQQGGTFTVTLTASGPGGSTTKSQQITIKSPVPVTAPTRVWDQSFGGTSFDDFYSIVPASDGGFLLGGHSFSGQNGNKTAPAKSGADYWIVKVDGNGNYQWDKTFGGTGDDYLTALVAVPGGGFVLGGRSNSNASPDKTVSTKGASDYWIIKIDDNGNKLWDRTFGGDRDDDFSSIILTADNGFLLGGQSNTSQNGDKTAPTKGLFDYWIVKTKSNGDLEWEKTIGGSGNEYLSSLTRSVNSDGSFLLGGHSSSLAGGDKSANSKGNFDYWVVRITANGGIIWDKTLGGAGDENLLSVVGSSDGGYVLGGSSSSSQSMDKTEATKGGSDYWVVKLDGSGNRVWDKTFGGSGDDIPRSVVVSSDGGFAIGGQSNSGLSGDKAENTKGGYDYWILKINASGDKVWTKTLGGSGDDMLYSMVASSDGGLVIGGQSNSGQSGDKSQANRGGRDYWVMKIK